MAKQIHLLTSTHQGILYDEACDYVVVSAREGEFAIMPGHVAIITTFKEGFLKLVRDNNNYFIALVNAVVEFHDDVLNVIASEAFIGRTKEKAKESLNSLRHERLNKNRKLDTDLEIVERDLRENIKNAKAGEI